MKKNPKVLTILDLFLLIAGPSLHAACSAATAAGAYGFTTTGTLILPNGPAPVAAVGLITFQLNGEVSGSQDRSVGGVFAHETITQTTRNRAFLSPNCRPMTSPGVSWCSILESFAP
jgi:hypothetical protein